MSNESEEECFSLRFTAAVFTSLATAIIIVGKGFFTCAPCFLKLSQAWVLELNKLVVEASVYCGYQVSLLVRVL